MRRTSSEICWTRAVASSETSTSLLDALGDGPTVHRFVLQGAQNQQIERARQQIGRSRHGVDRRHCQGLVSTVNTNAAWMRRTRCRRGSLMAGRVAAAGVRAAAEPTRRAGADPQLRTRRRATAAANGDGAQGPDHSEPRAVCVADCGRCTQKPTSKCPASRTCSASAPPRHAPPERRDLATARLRATQSSYGIMTVSTVRTGHANHSRDKSPGRGPKNVVSADLSLVRP